MKAEELKLRLLGEGLLALAPEHLDLLCTQAELGMAGEIRAYGEAKYEAAYARGRIARSGGRGVAVVPIYGALAQKQSMMMSLFGGASTEQIGSTLDMLSADKSIGTVVFDVHSPGGNVQGTPELATQIAELGKSKKTIAVANGVAASAAYWLASQANELVVTPSGEVGSIGVYMMHADVSQAMAAAGVNVTFISAGKHKIDGNEFAPLSDDARAHLQAQADDIYGQFVKAVADGRGASQVKVRSDYGEGRMLLARQALSAGMVDRIATLDQVLNKLGVTSDAPRTSLAAEQPDEAVTARRRAVIARLLSH